MSTQSSQNNSCATCLHGWTDNISLDNISPGNFVQNQGNFIRPLFWKKVEFPYGKFCLTKKGKLIYPREKISTLWITFPWFWNLAIIGILVNSEHFNFLWFLQPESTTESTTLSRYVWRTGGWSKLSSVKPYSLGGKSCPLCLVNWGV